MVAAVDIWPRPARNARSASVASRWISENATSPPRITRPSRASPSARLRANDATPAIAITPSAMQARNTRKPASPARSSRTARRSESERESKAVGANVMRAFYPNGARATARQDARAGRGRLDGSAPLRRLGGLRHEPPEQDMHRRKQQDRQHDQHADEPHG